MGKGGSLPPPPPDYSTQKAGVASATEGRYRQQAKEYNEAVGAFNKSIGTYGTQFEDYSNKMKSRFPTGMTISSLYDDPATAANENPYSDFSSTLTGMKRNLGRLDLGMEKPIFSPTVGSQWGTVGISNIPTLSRTKSNQQSMLGGDISDALTKLEGLNTSRRAEEERIKSFSNKLLSGLVPTTASIGGLTIKDEARAKELARDLTYAEQERQQFQSPILNQVMPSGFSNFSNRLTGAQTQLSNLAAKRTAEQTRISDYEKNLMSQGNQYRSEAARLGITDVDKINKLQDVLSVIQRGAGGFTSELGFDFADELKGITDVGGTLADTLTRRTAEEGRVTQAQRNFLNQARTAQRSAEGSSIYSQAALDAAGGDLTQLGTDIGAFSSVLPYDFSAASTSVAGGQKALAGITEKRKSALDKILAGSTVAQKDVGKIPLYDEQAMRDRLSSLGGEGTALSQFSGGRVGGIEQQIDLGVSNVNARLKELADYRTNLETKARSLVENVNKANYYDLSGLTGDTQSVDAMGKEIELYKAQQAMDELNVMETRLQSEKQRLETDAEAVKARQRTAIDDIVSKISSSTGLPSFSNLNLRDPITLQKYLQMLSSKEKEQLGITPQSAFSQNLAGVIKT